MNHKLLFYVKREGYCCLWAWLEANRSKLTSELMKELELGNGNFVCTVRALRWNRAAHRAKKTVCAELPACLSARVKAGHTILLRSHKEGDTGAGR